VVDMQRIVLTYNNNRSLIDELRSVGRNLHPQRFSGLRTPRWLEKLQSHALHELTFEVIYIHAIKIVTPIQLQETSVISLKQFRQQLSKNRLT
jgi:malonyl-CoA O-methyltransferase